MKDFYLKFADEAEANSVLYTTTPAVLDEETNVVSEETVKANYRNIDVIGVLYEAVVIEDPENPPAPVPMEGWHVNVRVVDDENEQPLEAFAVVPKLPRRIWG